MGQHKTNPTAVAAKKGELSSKPRSLGKRESERRLQEIILDRMYQSMFSGLRGRKKGDK